MNRDSWPATGVPSGATVRGGSSQRRREFRNGLVVRRSRMGSMNWPDRVAGGSGGAVGLLSRGRPP
ncbi:hypothetical protein, partial [Amycolatopsis tolypomycina]|uniref:hypothetical protein n=1 Tax=Amycolatopsis tolypomycina TaxID=208445 RepID=UPI0033BE693E